MRRQLLHAVLVLCIALPALPATAQWKSLGAMEAHAPKGNEIVFENRDATVELQFLAPDMVRVRMHVGKGSDPDFSWAVVKKDWQPVDVKFSGDKHNTILKTSALEVRVQLSPFELAFYDPAGNLISEDAHPMGWEGENVRCWKKMPQDEHYFGLGEKAGSLDKRGHAYVMWNTDPSGYDDLTDPMYEAIPFFMGIREGRAYGIFFDNTYRSSFDMGAESADSYSFGAEGGDLNYYFFAGPDPKQILSRYTELVGRMALPPMWSIGNIQSSAHYYPESTVRFVAENFRRRHIPCDAIFLDTVYMDGFRVFTWNKIGYPDPPKMISDLRNQGFHVFAIIDPGVKQDPNYWVYQQGVAGGHFLKKKNGELYIGNIWPGDSAFPDFTSEKTRDWWGSLFEGFSKDGISGFLTDMDEPTVNTRLGGDWIPGTFDPDVVYFDHGLESSAAKNHNIYGLLMSAATRDGMLRFRPNERPFVITRATYAGGQRYAAQWTGDNVASWEDFRASLRTVMSMGISGLPFTGSDTGGFIGVPSGELYTRWLEAGVFHPFLFTHTDNATHTLDPWSFGNNFEAINRRTIELRYRLLPYIYNAFYEATQTGMPVMRSLVLDFPGDRNGMDLTPDARTDEFLFGDDLLVAPVDRQGATQREVYLPKGTWYDFWSRKSYTGPTDITVDAPLDYIPIFVRGGAVIPMQPVVEHTGQPIRELTFEIFPEGQSVRSYYEDDGATLDYERGKYLLEKVQVADEGAQLRVSLSARTGSYTPPGRSLIFKVHGLLKAPQAVTVDGRSLEVGSDTDALKTMTAGVAYDVDTGIIWIKVADQSSGLEANVEK